jgi:pimeloyl-ACP methyl ester carboxylesterase
MPKAAGHHRQQRVETRLCRSTIQLTMLLGRKDRTPSFMVRPFFVLLCVVCSANSFARDVPGFRFVEKPGPYDVGLRVVEQYDYSRVFRDPIDDFAKPYAGERARPLQTLIWYPAEHSDKRPMTVADYVDLLSTETSFGRPETSAEAKEWLTAMRETVAVPLWAVRDATPMSGRHPIVIYAPSLSSESWENADLCEYLASHGYIVIASPSMGPMTREMSFTVAGFNAQARDISFLIGYATTLSNADMSKIAVVGYSWGGISNLVAAARDDRIRALVSLDGSLRQYPGLVKQAGDVHPEEMAIPMIYFAKQEDTLEHWALGAEVNAGPSVLNSWTHGDLITVRMLGLVHEEMSSMFQRNQTVWDRFPNEQNADYGREDGILGYALIARYTLQFLDAYMKHDPTAMAFLKRAPAENGVPKHFIAVLFRAASGVPPSLAGFRSEIAHQGFNHVADVYAAMRREDPDFQLDERAVDTWASGLIDHGHLLDGIELLKLNAQIHRESGGVYFSLAEAYANSGQIPLAIENYRTCLKLWPTNPDIERKIRALNTVKPSLK